jgi:hypothetical protein
MYFMLDMVRVGSILFNKILSTDIRRPKHDLSKKESVKIGGSVVRPVILVYIMSKIKFPRRNPRSIVQKRHDHPETLTVTIPKRIVKSWNLQAGQIVEFSTLVEGQEAFVKVKKVVSL